MPTYQVTMRAEVERVIEVEAVDECDAETQAVERFFLNTLEDDKYSEVIVDVSDVSSYRDGPL